MYERSSQPLLPRSLYLRRLLLHAAIAIAVILGSLGLGVLGYHLTEGLSWLDALLNAAMILGGMGPVDPLRSPSGKLFAAFYALFSGIVFLVAVGVLIAPVVHRFLHRLHLDVDDE